MSPKEKSRKSLPQKKKIRLQVKSVMKMPRPLADILDRAKPVVCRLDLVLFIFVSVVLLTLASTGAPQRRGDGAEYYQTLISFSNHASPDLREGDIFEYKQLEAAAAKESFTFRSDLTVGIDPYAGYEPSPGGKFYSIHFWLYSLAAVPIKLYLQAGHFDQLKAFQLLNALALIFALAMVLFRSGLDNFRRRAFAALILFSPAVWFLDWPSPEVFSYSFVVAAVALFTRKNLSLAILCAAIATTQNPPIAFLVLFLLIYGFLDVIRTKRYMNLAKLTAAASPVVMPMIFYYAIYGTPNLIYKIGAASFREISFSRTFNFFFDLNQGILPYLPGVLLFSIYLLLRGWKKGTWHAYEPAMIILSMVLLAQTTTNWNSGTEGIMRYAVWLLPLLYWIVVEGVDLAMRSDKVILALVLVMEVAVVFSYHSWFFTWPDRPGPILDTHMSNTLLAEYVLDNYPALYSPEPETFAERTLEEEVVYTKRLPVIYARNDGGVTKILTDYAGLEKLDMYVDVQPSFLEMQKQLYQGRSGLFYINLSPEEIRLEESEPLTNFRAGIEVQNSYPRLQTSAEYQIPVTVTNMGDEIWEPRGRFPIAVSWSLYSSSGERINTNNRMITQRMKPGQSSQLTLLLQAPEQPGNYRLEVDLVQANVASFKHKGNQTPVLPVEVT